MKETRDVDTAGSFGQMSFRQVGIDSGHGKQAGNDLHTCTLYICGSWAPKKSKNGDTNAWIFEKNSCLHTGWGGVHKGMAHEKSFGNTYTLCNAGMLAKQIHRHVCPQAQPGHVVAFILHACMERVKPGGLNMYM